MKTREIVKFREARFKELGSKAFANLQEGEYLTLSLHSENTLYTRFNQAKIRQTSWVDQSDVSFDFISKNREVKKKVELTWSMDEDLNHLLSHINDAREEVKILPETPFIVLPENHGESHDNHFLENFDYDNIHDHILESAQNVDLAGLLVAGPVMKANMNSLGQYHWFSAESFYIDYSLYSAKQKAVKSCYAGQVWNQQEWENNLSDSTNLLGKMDLPIQEVPRGQYKTYLSPSAVNEILGMMNWGGFSGGSYKQGFSALNCFHSGEKDFSEKFNLEEDFSLGMCPRFNERGEVTPEKVVLAEKGKHKSLLVSTKTAKEYTELTANAANGGEQMRSASILPGNLKKEDILKELGTGLFVSQLHYLNYSDRRNARITGMTRFACFWVEDGEVKGPIKDLRFDETLYNIFGENLIAVTDFTEIEPVIMTYEAREIGVNSVPGMLVDKFSYTL